MARKKASFNFRKSEYKTASGEWDVKKLQAEARRFAKAANQRLLTLEKAGLTASTAYQSASQAIAAGAPGTLRSKDDALIPRFRERTGRGTASDLLKQIEESERFLKSHMSRVGFIRKLSASVKAGIGNLTQYAADKGIDLKENVLLDLLKSEAANELTKRYGYDFVLRAAKDLEERLLEKQELDDDTIVEKLTEQFKNVLDPEKNPNLLVTMDKLKLSDDVKRIIKKKAKINPKTGRPKLPKSV